jgi:tryptophanyl-tRNA synthetase
MSKSFNNSILLSDDAETVRNKVQTMITDPQRIHLKDKGHPEICNVFSYRKIFAPDTVDDVEKACKRAGIGCTECKKKLASSVSSYLEPIQDRRRKFEKDTERIREMVSSGTEKARKKAQETMADVREAMNIK